MPDMFAGVYDPVVNDWIQLRNQATQSSITAMDPLTGQVVDVSTTVYADDIKERNMTRNETHRQLVVNQSTQILDYFLDTMDMAQNLDKAEHIPNYMNPGCVNETRRSLRNSGQRSQPYHHHPFFQIF